MSSSHLTESRARAGAAQQHFQAQRTRLVALNAEAIRIRDSFKRPQKTVDQINQEVKSLEFKRNTTSMSLQDEKKIIKLMEKLNSDRKVWDGYQVVLEKVAAIKQEQESIRATLDLGRSNLNSANADVKELAMLERISSLKGGINIDSSMLTTVAMTIKPDRIGLVVGKGGSSLRRLEERYAVVIDIAKDSGDVQIRGLEGDAQAASGAIAALDSEVSAEVKLTAPQSLMLRRGNMKYLKSLEDILSVQMRIPRPTDAPQAGAGSGKRSNNGDLLIVRGSQERVDAAVQLIKEIAQHSAVVEVPIEVIPVVLGPSGETISAIQEEFGVSIDLVRHKGTKSAATLNNSSKSSSARSTEPATATIWATSMSQLEGALARVQSLVTENKHEHVELDLSAFNAGAGVVIGKGGEVVRRLEAETGAMIRIESNKNKVTVSATKDKIHDAVKAVLLAIETYDKLNVDLSIGSEHGGLVFNKSGPFHDFKTEVTPEVTVTIRRAGGSNSNNLDAPGGDPIRVSIRGEDEALVAAAVQRVQQLVSVQICESLTVGRNAVSTLIGKGGSTISQLQIDTGAVINVVGGTRVDIRGEPANVIDAKQKISDLLQKFEDTNTQIYVLSDGLGSVIGKNGATIKKLREELSVKIDMVQSSASRSTSNSRGGTISPTARTGAAAAAAAADDDDSTESNEKENPLQQKVVRDVMSKYNKDGNGYALQKASVTTVKISGDDTQNVVTAKNKLEVLAGDCLVPIEQKSGLMCARVPMPHTDSSSILLGARGATIRGLQAEFGVLIEVQSRSALVTVTPRVLNGVVPSISVLHKCAAKVVKLLKQGVPTHDTLVLTGPSNITQLKQKGGLRDVMVESNASVKIEESENGTVTAILSGTAHAVTAAKEYLTDFINGILRDRVRVAENKHMAVLLTQGGARNLRRVGLHTGADVILVDEAFDCVRLRGTRKQLEDGKDAVRQLLKMYCPTDFVHLSIPSDAVPSVIGQKGANLRGIQTSHSVAIDVARGSGIGSICISGTNQQSVDAAKTDVLELVKQWEKANKSVPIPSSLIPAFIGRGGAGVRQFETDHKGVSVTVDRDGGVVRLRGKDADVVDKAIVAVAEHIKKLQETENGGEGSTDGYNNNDANPTPFGEAAEVVEAVAVAAEVAVDQSSDDSSYAFKGKTYSFLADDAADDGLEAAVARENAAKAKKEKKTQQQQKSSSGAAASSSTAPAPSSSSFARLALPTESKAALKNRRRREKRQAVAAHTDGNVNTDEDEATTPKATAAATTVAPKQQQVRQPKVQAPTTTTAAAVAAPVVNALPNVSTSMSGVGRIMAQQQQQQQQQQQSPMMTSSSVGSPLSMMLAQPPPPSPSMFPAQPVPMFTGASASASSTGPASSPPPGFGHVNQQPGMSIPSVNLWDGILPTPAMPTAGSPPPGFGGFSPSAGNTTGSTSGGGQQQQGQDGKSYYQGSGGYTVRL